MRFIRLGIMAVCAALIVAAPIAFAPAAQAASVKDQADDLEISALDLDAKGDLEGAILKHREALKLVPNNRAFKENAAGTLYKAAIAKHNAKDDTGAIAYLEEALSLVPNFKPAKESLSALKSGTINQEGLALLKAANYAGAAEKFKAVLALDPDNKAAKVNLDVAESQMALSAGDPATAVAKLTDAVALEPNHQFLKDKLAEAQKALDAKKAEEEKAAPKK
jgi:tetratricopeptide (TPR) repeat protein